MAYLTMKKSCNSSDSSHSWPTFQAPMKEMVEQRKRSTTATPTHFHEPTNFILKFHWHFAHTSVDVKQNSTERNTVWKRRAARSNKQSVETYLRLESFALSASLIRTKHLLLGDLNSVFRFLLYVLLP
eukprot:m.143043 g.143043  ORF g.143043 m.143043 type:complete len:128 (+) comp38376_c0_seq3:1914-2297(+)